MTLLTHDDDDQPKPFNFCIRPSVRAQLQQIAAEQERSIGWLLRRMIDTTIERHGKKKSAA
jgi:hypothetical protein